MPALKSWAVSSSKERFNTARRTNRKILTEKLLRKSYSACSTLCWSNDLCPCNVIFMHGVSDYMSPEISPIDFVNRSFDVVGIGPSGPKAALISSESSGFVGSFMTCFNLGNIWLATQQKQIRRVKSGMKNRAANLCLWLQQQWYNYFWGGLYSLLRGLASPPLLIRHDRRDFKRELEDFCRLGTSLASWSNWTHLNQTRVW